MKLTEEKKTFQSNIEDVQSVSFGISNMGFVLDLLRNKLYEKKIQTPVQEYIANAVDANREANSTRPIEITFPTLDNLTFSVQDWGIGISPDRLSNVFSMYGSSTKRETNVQAGGLGIGAKSAFAYTESFNIETVVDGTKWFYVSHIGNDQKGQIDLISESKTSEPNGTKISYAVKRSDCKEFEDAIIRSSMYRPEHEYPVFKNVSASARINIDAMKKIGSVRFMDTNLSGLAKDYYNRGVWIIIDSTPYQYTGTITPELSRLKSLVDSKDETINIFIPNGMVAVAASREKIDDSELSRKAFKQIFLAAITDFENAVRKWDENNVDSASLLSAQKNQVGFVLSSKKTFDFLSLKKGVYEFQTNRGHQFMNEENEEDECDEELFKVQQIGSDKRQRSVKPFDVTGPNKYYMTRPGVRKIEDIRNWVALNKNNGVGNVNLVVITALREKQTWVPAADLGLAQTPYSKTGEFVSTYHRQDDVAQEMIPVLERLGFKNIEELLPKVAKVKGPVIKRKVGNILEINVYNDTDSILSMDEVDKLPQNEKWIYYVGVKGDYEYKKFLTKAAKLKRFGQFDKAFRVLEKNLDVIVDDPRFVEFKEFEKTWEPSTKMVLSMVTQKNCQQQETNILKNITHNLKDHSSILFKASKCIDTRGEFSFDYETENLVKATAKYKELSKKVENLAKFTKQHFPLLRFHVENNAHNKEYVSWALDKVHKSGVNLDTLDIL